MYVNEMGVPSQWAPLERTNSAAKIQKNTYIWIIIHH